MPNLILIVDDEKDIRSSLQGILEDEGYQVITAENGEDAVDLVQEEVPDLVLLDIWMPGMDGIAALEQIKKLNPEITVIMMSGHGTIETAVRATKIGAFDFIEKPFSLDKLLITIGNAIKLKQLHKENQALRLAAHRESELIGATTAIENLRFNLNRVAAATTAVLITGETGTGKELAARVIHQQGSRRERPFIAVNCLAIPAELLYAELFGTETTNDSGTNILKKGRFDLADGGFIFLDEVLELPLVVQKELLKVLTDGSFERQGGERSVRCDLRIIASSSQAVGEAVKSGRFLADLFQRLQVMPLHMPPLRERLTDIPLLVQYFINLLHRREGWEVIQFSAKLLAQMQQYQWPGNVRELKNIVERIMIIATKPMVDLGDLPEMMPFLEADAKPDKKARLSTPCSLAAARNQFECAYLHKCLEELGWNIDAAAKSLDMERAALQRKLSQHNITPKNP